MRATPGRYLVVALATIALLAVVACGDDDEGGSGGTVAVQYDEFESFDPHFSDNAADFGHHTMVWRGLYRLDNDSLPQPEMADGLPDVSDDGLTYTVTLKDDLEWSDGDPLTAEDFVAGVLRTCSHEVASRYQFLLSNLTGCDAYANPDNAEAADGDVAELLAGVGVEATDDQTVVFRLDNPQPSFTIRLAMWMTYPVPTHIVTEPGAEWPAPDALAFNGPFVVSEYSPGERTVFTPNENYEGDQPRLDEVIFRYVGDDATSNNAFETGELDIVRADVTNLQSLQDEMSGQLVTVASPITVALYLNMENEALADPNVRKALSRATDRETLNRVPLQGANFPTTTWIPADVVGIEPDEFDDEVGFDPEAAAELLAEAGYEGGEGFPALTIIIGESPQNIALAEFLQAQWAEILGIDLQIESMDPTTRAQLTAEGNFEITTQGWGQDYADPESWVPLFYSESSLNAAKCNDERIDELIDAAEFNTDDGERRDQYREVNELISTELCGAIPMFHLSNHYLVSDQVGGVRENAGSQDLRLPGDWSAEDWYIIED